jgi:hypothetical protein
MRSRGGPSLIDEREEGTRGRREPGHIGPALAKRVLGAKGPRAPNRYCLIWVIFDPSSDASPIKPFSP